MVEGDPVEKMLLRRCIEQAGIHSRVEVESESRYVGTEVEERIAFDDNFLDIDVLDLAAMCA